MNAENETTAAVEALSLMAASREEMLAYATAARAKPKMQSVPAPELGPNRSVLVRQLDGPSGEALERSHFFPVLDKEKKETVFRYQVEGQVGRYVLACCCDDQGNRIFAPTDAEALISLPFSLQNRIFEAAKELNDPKIEAAAKN